MLLSCCAAAAGADAGNRKEDGDSFGKSSASLEGVEGLAMIFGMT